MEGKRQKAKGKTPTRRELFQTGAAAAGAGLLGGRPAAAAPARIDEPTIYTRIGVRPFINLTATYTINGGTLTLPEVKKAMEEASYFSVNLDELMEKVSARLAELLGCEAGMVSSGCAAALACATAACVAGAEPELMQQLPDTTGLKNEVIMPKQSRNVYDHAIRSAGVKIIEIDTRDEFHSALGPKTAMVAVLGTGEAKGKIRLEEIAEAAHKAGVPVLVDAAAELPLRPNPYLSRGADLVAYSGGKIIRGPQCAGLLLGRKDLVKAAWMNSAPHHAFGRALKAGKEEIMGMLAAIEAWVHARKIEDEYRTWQSWYGQISEKITRVPGIRTRVLPPAGASPFPVMEVAWDPEKIAMTAGELYDLLLNGEPRIMSHAAGEGHSFIVRPVSMKPEHPKLVADRLYDIFSHAPKSRPAKTLSAPAADLAGQWDIEVKFAYGSARHTVFLEAKENQLAGFHVGRSLRGSVRGTIDGDRVEFRSSMPVEGTRLSYTFRGRVSGGQMSGELDLDEYGSAEWTARRRA